MGAFAAVIVLFAFFWLVGLGVTLLPLRKTAELPQKAIYYAPMFGAAIIAILTISLNRVGLPVQAFALPMAMLLIAASGASIWRHRVILHPRQFRIPLLIVGVALTLFAVPFWARGFDWVSVSNDDMTNYCMSAARFRTGGFFSYPTPDPHRAYDPNLAYYVLEVLAGERAGVDELLAFAASLIGLSTFEMFMPFETAGHLCLIFAAITLSPRKHALSDLYVGLALALSPMIFLGTMLQLLGQVFGLGSLCIAASAWINSIDKRPSMETIVPCTIGFAALLLFYPELIVFLVLAYIIALSLAILKKKARIQAVAAPIISAIVAGIVLGQYTLTMITLLITRFIGLSRPSTFVTVSFPYYIVPSGFANLWGLLPIPQYSGDPLLSLAIGLGILLTVFWLIILVRGVRSDLPSAFVSLAILLVSIPLLKSANGFGLFKASMYVQPFLIVSFVSSLPLVSTSAVRHGIAVAILVILQIRALVVYAGDSYGLSASVAGAFNEAPGATDNRLLSRFLSLKQTTKSFLISDAMLQPYAKYEIGLTQSTSMSFSTRDELSNLFSFDPDYRFIDPSRRNTIKEGLKIIARRMAGFKDQRVCFPESGACRYAEFQTDYRPESLANVKFLMMGSANSIINRSAEQEASPHIEDGTIPRLFFVDTSIGQSVDALPDPDKLAINAPEPDPYFPGMMSGISHYLLFEVIPPRPTAKLEISLSATLNNDYDNTIPKSVIVGGKEKRIGFIGRGAARVVTPEIQTISVDGRTYVGVDFGRLGRRFPVKRTGLMKLFGAAIPLDPRYINLFARDVSLAHWDPRRAPTRVSHFPTDLQDNDLLFSGIYEDGWISNESFFSLRSESPNCVLEFSGVVPQIGASNFSTRISVMVDGRIAAIENVGVGDFDIKANARGAPGVHYVRISFDRVQRLPGDDGRPVGALVKVLSLSKS